jgi:hypothetical protein
LGRLRPRIWFRDYTGTQWPVSAAATEWNRSTVIDVGRINRDASCPSDTHCVSVTEWNRPDDSEHHYCGKTYITLVNGSQFSDNTWIELNNTGFNNGWCNAGRRGTACHELGHALGVDHNGSTTSCMYGKSISGRSTVPNSDDFSLLFYVIY